MSTPLVATDRLELRYQINGYPHKARAYVIMGTPVLAVPQVVYRDAVSHDWLDAAQGQWDTFRNFFEPGSVDSNVTFLQHFDGVSWVDVSSIAPVGAGAGGATFAAASQLTLVANDTAGKKVRITLLEGGSGYVGHSTDGSGIDAHILSVASGFKAAGFPGDTPYAWQVSRSNLYLFTGVPLAGVTLDLNDKLKRGRHLE